MGALGVETEVDEVARGRYVSVDEGERVGTVVSHCVYVYLFFLLVPVHFCVEHTHASVLE